MPSAASETVANDITDSDDDVYDDEHRFMNKEETRQYEIAALKSDGFDVPYFPGTGDIGRIEPIRSSYFAGKLREIAQAAFDHYNNAKGCNYEIVKIKKANHRACRCKVYYITFDVKPVDSDDPITTFQARVLRGLPDEPLEFEICRPEPEEHKHLNSLEGVLVEDLNWRLKKFGSYSTLALV